MVLDLNKCLFYFDGSGRRRKKPLRYLTVVDGIVAGEGDGPMTPDPKPCGIILAGTHPVAVDCVAASLMGFDWRRIPLLRQSFEVKCLGLAKFTPKDIRITSENPAWEGPLGSLQEFYDFKPHFGWVGALERLEG